MAPHQRTTRSADEGQGGRAPLLALGAAASLFVLAPHSLDPTYDWVEHTTSEAAGQGVEGAWITRTAFLLFGGSVLLLAERVAAWPRASTALHRLFGATMICVAAFSSRSWVTDAPFDETEDLLHSIAATVVGFAFAFAVTTVAIVAQIRSRARGLYDWVAVGASVVLPLEMAFSPDLAGALQRLMFGLAILWYGREAIGTFAPAHVPSHLPS